MSVVIQVPMTRLTADGGAVSATNSVIGIYDSAERLQNRTINGDGTVSVSGPEFQVSRLGHPLVNEVVIGLADKDRFNATKPTGDGAFLSYVTNPELPGLFNALYGIPAPPTPRNDLVAVFLTGVPGLNQPANPNRVACEMLRLNMAIAPGVLVPGFNNAPANQLGDGVDANDKPFLPYFPYVNTPNNPLDNVHYVTQNGVSANSLQPHVERLGGLLPANGGTGTAPAGIQLASANPGRSHVLVYAVPALARVTLRVYAANGRLVRTLVDQDAAAGSFRATWDGRDDNGATLARGMYFARYTAGGQAIDDKKLILE
jgi:hypothetical protein